MVIRKWLNNFSIVRSNDASYIPAATIFQLSCTFTKDFLHFIMLREVTINQLEELLYYYVTYNYYIVFHNFWKLRMEPYYFLLVFFDLFTLIFTSVILLLYQAFVKAVLFKNFLYRVLGF